MIVATQMRREQIDLPRELLLQFTGVGRDLSHLISRRCGSYAGFQLGVGLF